MSLLADLRHGTYGIQFNPPPPFALEVDKDTFASFRDEDHRVDWYLEYSPLIVDLSPSLEEILRADLHIDTTAVFESCFESSRHRQDSSAGTERSLSLPRTKREPTWSPVISVHRVTLGGVPALQVIYRMAYAPGDELIIGRMILPLAQGTVYLSALRRAEVTGVRESVLAITTLPSA
ncbi:MAG: hypothetical protein HP496_16695, partial [Nitrospira sp.]|nr:hypothetical protein [Nitrospira sp.]